MKPVLPLLGAALLAAASAAPATTPTPIPTLGGNVSGSLPSGTYRVTDDLVVPVAATWSLPAGTELRFDAGRGLRVLGRLLAVGSPDRPVRLVPDSPLLWSGLIFAGTADRSNRLEWIVLEGAQTGLTIDPAASLHLTVADSRIRSHRADGVLIAAGAGSYRWPEHVSIERCLIEDNGQAGISITSYAEGCDGSSSSPILRGNEIAHNGGPGISLLASVHSIHTCSPVPVTSLVQAVIDANVLHDNQEGIRAEARGPSQPAFPPPARPAIEARIVNNLIRDHRADGIVNVGGACQPRIINNTLLRNAQAGIAHSSGIAGEGRVRNNLVVGNGRGLQGSASGTPPLDAVAFNNVFGNGQDWVAYPPAYGRASHTNASGHPADLADNLSLDPGLGGPDGAHLLAGSSMIDAGPLLDAPRRDREGDPRGTRVDLGCDEFRAPFRLHPPHVSATHLDAVLEGEPGVEYSLLASPWVEGGLTRALGRRASPVLLRSDLPVPRDLLEALFLDRHREPALEYVWNRLPAATQALINGYFLVFPRPDPEPVAEPLLHDLNAILSGPSIYQPNRFATVTLSPTTAALAARNPTGTGVHHLNRLLLEDLLPEVFVRAGIIPDATGHADVWIAHPEFPAAYIVGIQTP